MTTTPRRAHRRRHPTEHHYYNGRRVIDFLNHWVPGGITAARREIRDTRGETTDRRLRDLQIGRQTYISLRLLDEILTILDLHLSMIGDPDLNQRPNAGTCRTRPQMESPSAKSSPAEKAGAAAG
jgi:hypothetical protein